MRSKELKRPETDWVLLAMTLFEATAFILLAFRDGFDFVPLILAVSVPLLLVAQVLLLGRAYPHMDSYILIIVNFLCGVGLIMLYRLDAGRALRQLLFYGVGVMAMMGMTFLVARYRGWRKLRLLIMLASVAMLGLTLLIGEENGGAKNWIDLGFLSIQPSEFVKVALVLCLAMDLSERRTVRQLVPVGLFAVACVGLIVLQKDLGAVLICFLTCLTVYYVATSNWMLALAGLVCAAAGSTVLYHLFDHVRTRVAIWQNPWDSPQGSGYQIIQSLISIASGGHTRSRVWPGQPGHRAGGRERLHLLRHLRGVRHPRRAHPDPAVRDPVCARAAAGHAGPQLLPRAAGGGGGDVPGPADVHDRRRRHQDDPAHGRDAALCQLRRLLDALEHADAGDFAGRLHLGRGAG